MKTRNLFEAVFGFVVWLFVLIFLVCLVLALGASTIAMGYLFYLVVASGDGFWIIFVGAVVSLFWLFICGYLTVDAFKALLDWVREV